MKKTVTVPTFAWLEKLSISEAEELLMLVSKVRTSLLERVIKERILLLKDMAKSNIDK